jgi:SAM-dependent methyltransferase
MGFFDDSLHRPFDRRDVHPQHFGSGLSDEAVARLNADNIYYGVPPAATQQALAAFLSRIAPHIERQLAQKWRVVNVRAWRARPKSSFGPSDWHSDGGPCFVRKILLYPVAPNAMSGSIDFSDRAGNCMLLDSASPAGILYDSAVLLHRGHPGESAPRPIIEITIAPAATTDVGFVYAGQNARFPRAVPSRIAEPLARSRYAPREPSPPPSSEPPPPLQARVGRAVRRLGAIGHPDPVPHRAVAGESRVLNMMAGLNIGGGPRFSHPGWVNLEGAPGAENPIPFSFTPECLFPFPSSAIPLVYSSHCLEHLDDATVDRVLQQARRVLAADGRLLLKLPDFELTKRAWAEKQAAFFAHWGLEPLMSLWRANGVEDNLTNRAAMIFCGYWNRAYGDHFSGAIVASEGAYHGPPKMPQQRLEQMLAAGSPHAIAQELVRFVCASEPSPTFNHQNAWSAQELVQLLARNGFAVESLDAAALCRRYWAVPGILEMKEISVYCLAAAQG